MERPGRPDVASKPPPPPRTTSNPVQSDPHFVDANRAVPTAKVTPLPDEEEYDDTSPPSEDPPGSGRPRKEVTFDWESIDPELLQHCRTTNPVLHENKYWV